MSDQRFRVWLMRLVKPNHQSAASFRSLDTLYAIVSTTTATAELFPVDFACVTICMRLCAQRPAMTIAADLLHTARSFVAFLLLVARA